MMKKTEALEIKQARGTKRTCQNSECGARGIRRLRDAVALVLIAGCAGGAWANRLDKTACADLSAEVSSLLASGVKEDMDKGPGWGAANLSLERLVAINRVIDLQGQLEFRCGSGKVAKSPAETPSSDQATSKTSTAKSSGEAGDETPSLPTQKASPVRGKRGSAAKSMELSPVAPATAAPATASHAAASPAPAASPTPNSPPPPPQGERTSATSPSAASPPQPTTVAPISTAPKAASTTPATIPPPAPTNVAATPAVQKSAARKKSSRRDGRAYVSPKEANPFSLLLGN
jgi:hypothetical protein